MEPNNPNQKEKKIQFWIDYWPLLQQATKETESRIDKKVYGIAIGGIGVEIASLQFIKIVCFKWLAFFSGLLLVATLVINLYSHIKSLKSQEMECDTIQLFFEENDNSDDSHIYDLIKKENQSITQINNISIWTMVIALLSLFMFVVLNV